MNNEKRFTLNFHSIFSDEVNFHQDAVYSFHVNKLEKLFQEIKERKLKVDITFDDGHLSDLYFAVPLLIKYQLDATFFVVAEELLSNPEKWLQTQQIHALGFKIGSHAYHHVDMTSLNTYHLLYESFESKKIIESCIASKIDRFAIPYGKYNKEIADIILKTGFNKIYTTNGSPLFNEAKITHRWSIKNHHSVAEIINVLEDKGIKAKFINQFLKLKHFKNAMSAIW